MTTSNYDTTITTQVGLTVKSLDNAFQRIENLRNLPDGLLFAKECSILLSWLAKANVDSETFTYLKAEVEHQLREKKRL